MAIVSPACNCPALASCRGLALTTNVASRSTAAPCVDRVMGGLFQFGKRAVVQNYSAKDIEHFVSLMRNFVLCSKSFAEENWKNPEKKEINVRLPDQRR